MAPTATKLTIIVSAEQRAAIQEFCGRQDVQISAWCRTTLLTAAGRPELADAVGPRGNPALIEQNQARAKAPAKKAKKAPRG